MVWPVPCRLARARRSLRRSACGCDRPGRQGLCTLALERVPILIRLASILGCRRLQRRSCNVRITGQDPIETAGCTSVARTLMAEFDVCQGVYVRPTQIAASVVVYGKGAQANQDHPHVHGWGRNGLVYPEFRGGGVT